jgi:hypothetical protein
MFVDFDGVLGVFKVQKPTVKMSGKVIIERPIVQIYINIVNEHKILQYLLMCIILHKWVYQNLKIQTHITNPIT